MATTPEMVILALEELILSYALSSELFLMMMFPLPVAIFSEKVMMRLEFGDAAVALSAGNKVDTVGLNKSEILPDPVGVTQTSLELKYVKVPLTLISSAQI